MKKYYVSLFSLVLAFGANAQKAEIAIGHLRTNAQPVALEEPTVNPSVAAAGDTIEGYYFDFSDPTAWTFGNSSTPAADWVIGTDVPSGEFAIQGIESTTAFNGFAMFDSDGLGNSSSSQNAWVQLANPVDLTGYGSVNLIFQQYYRKFEDNVYVEVSTDGTTWTTYEVNGTVAVNSSTTNPETFLLNISSVAADQAQVWVRFRFQGGWDYAWMVDDVAFVEGASNEIVMNNVWHGNIITDWEYSQIPLDQVSEVVIGAAIVNQGSDLQTGVEFTYELSFNGSVVSSGTFPAASDTLFSAAFDTTWFTTDHIPSEAGDYSLTISVASDLTDEDTTNNAGSSSFKVTDFIFAHDDESNINIADDPEDAQGNPVTYKVGAYYQPLNDALLTGVQTAFGLGTNAESCLVEVFDPANDAELTAPLVTELYDIESGDISTGSNINLVTIPLNDGEGLELAAGTVYLIVVGNVDVSGGRLVMHGTNDGDLDRAGRRYGPFGTGSEFQWNVAGYSPLVRAVFDPSVGIAENQDLTGIQMFPNPAADELTVKFNANERNDILVNVVSMDGKVVYTQSVNAFSGQFTSRISLDGLSTGLYSVQVMSNNAAHTQKVAVVK